MYHGERYLKYNYDVSLTLFQRGSGRNIEGQKIFQLFIYIFLLTQKFKKQTNKIKQVLLTLALNGQ